MSNTKKVVLIVTGVVLVCLIGVGIVMAVYAAGCNNASDFLGIFNRTPRDGGRDARARVGRHIRHFSGMRLRKCYSHAGR